MIVFRCENEAGVGYFRENFGRFYRKISYDYHNTDEFPNFRPRIEDRDTRDAMRYACPSACTFLMWFGKFLQDINDNSKLSINVYRVDQEDVIVSSPQFDEREVQQCIFDHRKAKLVKTLYQ